MSAPRGVEGAVGGVAAGAVVHDRERPRSFRLLVVRCYWPKAPTPGRSPVGSARLRAPRVATTTADRERRAARRRPLLSGRSRRTLGPAALTECPGHSAARTMRTPALGMAAGVLPGLLA